MAVISNKNITTRKNVVQNQITNNPVQNQNLAIPQSQQVQQIPTVQVPIQIQPTIQPNTQSITGSVNQIGNNVPESVSTVNNQSFYPINNPKIQNNQTNNNQTQQVQTFGATANINENISTRYPNQPNVTAPVEYNQNNNNNNLQNNTIKTTSENTGKTSTWTPIKITNTDLTTSEGQYQSAYSNTINELVNSILSARFEYNPEEDDLLQLATEYATQTTFESMNSRGILNSSMTGERVAKVISDLTYQYQELAREDFENEFNRMLNVANLLMSLDQNEYEKFVDNRNYQYQLKQDEYERMQDEIAEAWNRVDLLGYVDNEASEILGLAVGTLSKDARERVENLQDELELYQKKLEMEQNSDLELYKLKAEIDKQTNLEEYEKKAIIDSYYGGSNSSSSSNSNQLSTYESIIKNRYATKNINDQYEVSNKEALLDYLEQENKAGRLSNENALILIAKYSLDTANTNNTNSNQYTITNQLNQSRNGSNKGILEKINSQMNN